MYGNWLILGGFLSAVDGDGLMMRKDKIGQQISKLLPNI